MDMISLYVFNPVAGLQAVVYHFAVHPRPLAPH